MTTRPPSPNDHAMRQIDPIPCRPNGDRATVASLTEGRCADPAFAGPDLAALARVRDVLPVPPTLLAISAPDLWSSSNAAASVLREVRRQLEPFRGATTVRGWLQPPGGRIGPVWFNIGPAAIEEAASELAGLALRDAHDDAARLVVAVQAFVPPEVSVLARVDPDGGAVRLRSCWGLDEDLGAGVWHDDLVVGDPATVVEAHRVVHKPTATAPAGGGTQIVEVRPELRGKPSLTVEQAVPIAEACARMARRLASPMEFELALVGGRTYLLSCLVA
jgi:hypothetical protein